MRCTLVRGGLIALALLAGACGQPRSTSGADQVPFPAYRIRGRWPESTTISFVVDDGSSPLAPGVLHQAVLAAHEVWRATGVVDFVPAGDGAQADVTYAWRFDVHDTCQAFGRDMSIAHTGPVLSPTFVHFDARAEWSLTGASGHSLSQAAAHESGHVLGLGHSDDASSLMYTEATELNTTLSAEDRAAVASLFAGPGHRDEAHPADLHISGGGLRLRRIAPRATTDFSLFDSDGDGDDELFIWSTDASQASVLMIYHFESGPHLARSVGPIYGQTVAGQTPHLGLAESGERVMVTVFDDGTYVARRFERRGLLELRPDAPLVLPHGPSDTNGDGKIDVPASASGATSGDLDGDGTPETVTRAPN